ncbi:hypothetical protein SAMN05428947_101653 [Mucilaginibacter sp. OK283]|nr:hypothetical protein SAMN05428947_101653 [Mucilaginibacter sp. OK283]
MDAAKTPPVVKITFVTIMKNDKILLVPVRKHPQLLSCFKYICPNIRAVQTVVNSNIHLPWQIILKKQASTK